MLEAEAVAGQGATAGADDVFDDFPDGALTVTPEGEILSWNKAAVEIYGHTRVEALGRLVTDLIVPPDNQDDVRRKLRLALESDSVRYQCVRRRKDGTPVYVDVAMKAAASRTGGGTRIVISARDVTEVVYAREAAALEIKFRGLLETAPDAMVIVNRDGRVVLANSQTERLFGYAPHELRGKPVEQLVPARFSGGHPGHRTAYFADPHPRPMGAGLELFACRKDGTEFPVEISLSPIETDEGRLVTAAIRDVTSQRTLEEQLRRKNEELESQSRRVQEANRLKSEFLANMSHELRTPLNAIIGFAELLHDGKVGPVSAEQAEFLGDIVTSSRHLLQLINDILDLSKVESGKMEFRADRVDLGRLVGEVRDILRSLPGTKRIPVGVEVAPELGEVVTDAGKLKQVLYNYLSNALKFTTDEGRVTVRVTPEGPDRFRLEVEDSGIGISHENLGRLFVEFQQLDAGAAKRYAGTGLGLALTRRIVEAQGGEVGVRSTPGRGSVFFAVLPRVGRGLPETEADAEVSQTGPSEAPRLLVVEDDARDRRWLVQTLTGAGYAVVTAATGAAAVDRAREQPFAAVTLDLLLPDMAGCDVARAIRATGPNRDTPVIVVTVVPDKRLVAGFSVHDILAKPIQASELLESLDRAGLPRDGSRDVLVVDDDPQALKLAARVLEELGYRPVCRSDGESGLSAAADRPAAVLLDLLMPRMDGYEFLTRLRRSDHGRRVPVLVWTSKELGRGERARLLASVQAVVMKSDGTRALLAEVQAQVPLPVLVGLPEPGGAR